MSGREREAEEGCAVEEVSLLGGCLAPQPRDVDGAARHAGGLHEGQDETHAGGSACTRLQRDPARGSRNYVGDSCRAPHVLDCECR